MDKSDTERPQRFWFKRCTLNETPRMMVLNLVDDWQVSYNLATCSLDQIWKGGVHWHGAPYDGLKTVQPQSWGSVARKLSGNGYWTIEGMTVQPKFVGYRLTDQQIEFEYHFPEEDLTVFERPELIAISPMQVILERTFETRGKSAKVAVDAQPLTRGSSFFTDTLQIDQEPVYSDPMLHTAPAALWLDRAGCNTCHDYEEDMTGPSYGRIAQRYETAAPDIIDLLTERVFQGSSGHWGDRIMTAHPNLAKSDIANMVRFIRAQLPAKPKKTSQTSRVQKLQVQQSTKPGFGGPLEGMHPAFEVEDLRPEGFNPKVGALAVEPDGALLVATWDSLGLIYRIRNPNANPDALHIDTIASGLAEVLGMTVYDGRIYVMQKHELTELTDRDGDGVIDHYHALCNSFGVTDDFHEFSYGLVQDGDRFYATLGLAMRLMKHQQQNEDRGTAIRVDPDGSFEIVARGLRQPNGIMIDSQKRILITENQGQWAPACKIIALHQGEDEVFYGCQFRTGDRFESETVTPPALWLPQDEIGNSPTQPIELKVGPYQGQYLYGDINLGGLKRFMLEEIDGVIQGAAFRFGQGLEVGINRLAWSGDSLLFAGGVGMSGNWDWQGTRYGLQRMRVRDHQTFDIQQMNAQPDGFDLVFTQALDQALLSHEVEVSQWTYMATEAYGGPKLDLQRLQVSMVSMSDDNRRARLTIPGLKSGYIIYLRLGDQIRDQSQSPLWTGECWYTLNKIPDEKLPM